MIKRTVLISTLAAALLCTASSVFAADMQRDMTRDMQRDMTRDMQRDMTRDIQRDIQRDMMRDKQRDMLRSMTQDRFYGSQLMTEQERIEHRKRLQNAKSDEEIKEIRNQNHERMKERAKEQGVSIPEQPPVRGNQ